MLNVLLSIESALESHRTGIPHYTWNLLNGMSKNENISSLRAFNGNRIIKYNNVRPTYKPAFLDRVFHRFQHTPILKNLIYTYSIGSFERFNKTKIARSTIYHEPNFIVKPFGGLCVTTLHDITCLRFPEFQPGDRVTWFAKGLEKTLAQAQHIICVSEFIRNESISYLGLSPDKVTSIYHGVSDEFHPRSESEIQKVLKKYKLKHKGYLLSVSTIEPRKNIKSLIKGYLNLPVQLREQYPLILVGAIGWKISDLIHKIKNNKTNNIRILGYVPQNELALIFSGAKAFSYLSLYEGFGLPVLEALASGVPVLTSIDSPMAEFSKQHALVVDPQNVDAICDGIKELLMRDFTLDQASTMANYYRENFSWEKCIDKTLDVYKKVLSGA